MKRLVSCHMFHGLIIPSHIVPFYSHIVSQFQCKTQCGARLFWVLSLKNEVYTLVTLRLVKGSDYKVVYYNLFSVSINITLYFSPMNKCLQNFSFTQAVMITFNYHQPQALIYEKAC